MPLGDTAVEVARVVRTHGVSGALVVLTAHDEPHALLRAPRVLLDGEPGMIPYRVREARPLGLQPPGVRVLLELVGLDTRERAREWIGAWVRLERPLLDALEPGEVYGRDLLGLRCFTVQGRDLGVVQELWPTPACDQLLIVAGDRSRFVPALPEVLRRVDIEGGRIEVDLEPLGLDARELDPPLDSPFDSEWEPDDDADEDPEG